MTPEDWTRRRLADVATYRAGRTPARANTVFWAKGADGVPWVSIADMTEFGVITDTKERITKEAFEVVFKRRAVRAGTLIMSFKLTIGRVATLGVDACHNEAIIAIYPKHGIDQRYLGYFLSHVDYDALQDRQIKGNTLNQEKIDRIEISLPLPSEQVQISDMLDSIRRAILVQMRSINSALELKTAAMRALFTRGLRSDTQKQSEIGLVPEAWDVCRLGDNAFAISKGASPKWQGFQYVNTGVLFVRSQNVGDGSMVWSDPVYLPIEWNQKEKRSILKTGDVLINLVGASIGRCAVGGEEINGANCNQAVCFVRTDPRRLIPDFLCGFLLTEKGQEQINGAKKDIARANLSLEDVRQILVPRPSLPEQEEFAVIVNAVDRKIKLHRRKHALLQDLFQIMLHKLVTGEIRAAQLDSSTFSPSAPAAVGA